MLLDYSQDLTKEATLLSGMGRKRKVEFTGDCVLGKEADFKTHFCVLIYLPFFFRSRKFNSFPLLPNI